MKYNEIKNSPYFTKEECDDSDDGLETYLASPPQDLMLMFEDKKVYGVQKYDDQLDLLFEGGNFEVPFPLDQDVNIELWAKKITL